MKAWLVHPAVVAALATGLNAFKPAAVDDTAYLQLARQIEAHPLDPYGGEMFWYDVPVPALHVLAPAVLPYWLAAGIVLFGEHLPVLKLWLFPIPLILCYAVRSLARRFAPGHADVAVPAIALSPFVLPLFGVMLDVPALALGLAALAVFIRNENRGWLAAGLIAGVAMQTKYTAFLSPAVIFWYGLLHRRVGAAVLAGVLAVGVFAGWEAFLYATYGESHFLHHSGNQSNGGRQGFDLIGYKIGRLVFPLLTDCGGLGFGFALLVISWGRRTAALITIPTICFLVLLLLPRSATVFLGGPDNLSVRLDLAGIVFTTLGVFWFVMLGWSIFGRRPDRTTLFLGGWFVIELAGYYALTPFPAGRRVIGVCFVAGLIFLRAAEHLPVRWWVWGYGMGLGVALFALDAWDARPEKEAAEFAARYVREHGGGRTWFNGHWGFQYYCDREGMKPLAPGRSRPSAGDWIVYPALPDDVGFYRPYHGGAKFPLVDSSVSPRAEYVWLDAISGQTIPELYGGKYPFVGRDHPRLRVVVYRVIRDWE